MTTTTPNQPKIKINGPAGIIAAVPSLLGFRPEESLVMVCIAGKQLSPVARVDLPTGAGRAQGERQLARQFADQAARHAEAVFILVYTSQADPASLHRMSRARGPRLYNRVRSDLIGQLQQNLAKAEIPLLDAILVRDNHFVLYQDNPRTHPAIPVPGPDDEVQQQLEVANLMLGRSVLRSRQELADSVAGPVPGSASERSAFAAVMVSAARLSRLLHSAGDAAGDLCSDGSCPAECVPENCAPDECCNHDRCRALDRCCRHGSETDLFLSSFDDDGEDEAEYLEDEEEDDDDDELSQLERELFAERWELASEAMVELLSPSMHAAVHARSEGLPLQPETAGLLVAAIMDRGVRDKVLEWALANRVPGTLPYFIELLAWTPQPMCPEVAVVTAILAYREGDGALAQVCLDRVLATEPEHRLTGLVLQMINQGVKPATLDEIYLGRSPRYR